MRLHIAKNPLILAMLVALVAGSLRADRELTPEREANRKKVATNLAERQTLAGDNDDLLVGRGFIADRKQRKLTLDAEATGIQARQIVEFPIITENSSHDYEALFAAFAKPSEIVKALEFIGVKRGRPASPASLNLWPKGERVDITAVFPDGTRHPIEKMILDASANDRPLPVIGFIHAGSIWTERDGQPHCAADDAGPGSIASSYNELTTVLDMPRLAVQGEVYERFLANPETILPKDQFVTLELTPERRPSEFPQRVIDMTLEVSSPDQSLEIGTSRFRLIEAGADADKVEPAALADVIKAFREVYRPQRDPYVTLDLNDNLALQATTDLARLLDKIDNEFGARIEAPLKGQLYYRAFTPREDWRARIDRPTQPCELRFTRGEDDKLSVSLVRIEEIWTENPDNLRPDLKIHEQPVPSPAELPALLAATKVEMPVLLVFAPGDARLGDIMPHLRLIQESHPNIHVFVE